jgi:protein phosphatase 2C family protein 2/3
VSRTFGDVEAKLVEFGGLPNVIIAIPEINSFEIKENIDFIVLGCIV